MQRKGRLGRWRAAARKRLRQAYVRLLRSPGAPHEIAGGLAVGLLVAFLPVLQMPVAVGLAAILGWITQRRLSRVAAAAGVWLTNPITAGPLYGLSFLVGRPIVGLVLPSSVPADLPALDLSHLWSMGPVAMHALLALLFGGVIVGVPVALIGYWFAHRMVSRYQNRRRERRTRAGVAVAVPALAR